ncbi:MAG: hypothetical protein ACXIT9_03630 [Nitritalea sp.]
MRKLMFLSVWVACVACKEHVPSTYTINERQELVLDVRASGGAATLSFATDSEVTLIQQDFVERQGLTPHRQTRMNGIPSDVVYLLDFQVGGVRLDSVEAVVAKAENGFFDFTAYDGVLGLHVIQELAWRFDQQTREVTAQRREVQAPAGAVTLAYETSGAPGYMVVELKDPSDRPLRAQFSSRNASLLSRVLPHTEEHLEESEAHAQQEAGLHLASAAALALECKEETVLDYPFLGQRIAEALLKEIEGDFETDVLLGNQIIRESSLFILDPFQRKLHIAFPEQGTE